MSDLIEHLIEVDRRKLYLEEACASLSSYCIERLGHSEDEAGKRVRVTRLAARFPSVLEGLRSGAFHLSGLYLLAPYVTAENHAELLAEARGLSKRALEMLVARRFPKPDAPELLTPVPVQGMLTAARDCEWIPVRARRRCARGLVSRWESLRLRRRSGSALHEDAVSHHRASPPVRGRGASDGRERKARQMRRTRKTTAGEQRGRLDERASPVRARPRTEVASTDGASTAEPANSDGGLTAVQGALRTLGFTQAEIANATVALGTMNVVRERGALLRAALQMLAPGS